MSEMKWHSSMIYARDASWTANKPVLLYFHDPDSRSCKHMDADTFSIDKVIQFINDHFIPLQLDHKDHPFSREYNIIWTPTLIVLDQDGKEFQRSLGYMKEDELLAVLLLGVAKVYFKSGKYDAAQLHLDQILEKHPQSDTAPEALYFSGVNKFRWNNDLAEMRKAHEILSEKYPHSGWTEKASPYRNVK